MNGTVKFKYEPANTFEIKAGRLWTACILGLICAFLFRKIWPMLLFLTLSQITTIRNSLPRLFFPEIIKKLDKVANAGRLTDRDNFDKLKKYSNSVIFEYYQTPNLLEITVFANGISHSDNVSDLTRRFGEVFGITPYVSKRTAESITYHFPISGFKNETINEDEF